MNGHSVYRYVLCNVTRARAHLHVTVRNILVIMAHHVGEEGHVVGHLQAPMHCDGLARKQAVGMAASHPRQNQAHPQWSWHQHCDSFLVCLNEYEFLFGSVSWLRLSSTYHFS